MSVMVVWLATGCQRGERMTEKEKPFMVAAEVAELLRCSKPTAYRIMGRVNKKLASAGKIIIHGRVSRKALYEEVGLRWS